MNTKQIEIQLLLDAMRLKYGYDFRGYSRDMMCRRIDNSLSKSNLNSITELTAKVIHDPEFFSTLIYDISIPVTEMFRDPSVYLNIKQKVFPILKTYPYINIWHAGCATGEEVYSMAIALKEEGLYDRCQIYATDINDRALKKAREGIYPADRIQKYTQNYQQSGGTTSFSNYYHAMYESAKFDESLKENVTFASHNLVTDGVFAEMNLILCRNVFIYFDKMLQNKVLALFDQSLCRNGFLCLGSSESLTFTDVEKDFFEIEGNEKIYKKNQRRLSRHE
jgi:chemotaxis protein methyltransferase CheR